MVGALRTRPYFRASAAFLSRHTLSQAKRRWNGLKTKQYAGKNVGGGSQMPLPRRILILGPSGAGKSTLGRRIGTRLGLPVVHLDTFHWNPGWIENEAARFRERLAEAVAGDAWVM